MSDLSFSALTEMDYNRYLLKGAPEKIMQFGEGNFLRAFVNYWFDIANEIAGWNGKCVIIKPRISASPVCGQMNKQDGLYTVHLRGMENGEKTDHRRLISSVSRCINPYTENGYEEMIKLAVSDNLEFVVSNTTEAGIVYDPACQFTDRPCSSFPGKLTQVLYSRFCAGQSGLVILPCELNDNNGDLLKDCVLRYSAQWALGDDFITYLNRECLFCNTLVDRIVSGGIKDSEELEKLNAEDGYQDSLRVVGEVFGSWIIEGPAWLEDRLPFKTANINCNIVPDVTPYKKRKVRILNGAHTGFVPGAYLAGYDIVRDCMQDDVIICYMNRMLFDEVIPTLSLDREDLERFAASVQDRFNNPFIDHALLSICLNSTSKWRARNLPSLLDNVSSGTLPKCLAMSFAAYIAFYSGDLIELNDDGLVCRRPKGDTYICSDERWILEFYFSHRNDSAEDLVHAVMTNEQMWGQDLTAIPGFEETTVANLNLILEKGAAAAFASCL